MRGTAMLCSPSLPSVGNVLWSKRKKFETIEELPQIEKDSQRHKVSGKHCRKPTLPVPALLHRLLHESLFFYLNKKQPALKKNLMPQVSISSGHFAAKQEMTAKLVFYTRMQRLTFFTSDADANIWSLVSDNSNPIQKNYWIYLKCFFLITGINVLNYKCI